MGGPTERISYRELRYQEAKDYRTMFRSARQLRGEVVSMLSQRSLKARDYITSSGSDRHREREFFPKCHNVRAKVQH